MYQPFGRHTVSAPDSTKRIAHFKKVTGKRREWVVEGLHKCDFELDIQGQRVPRVLLVGGPVYMHYLTGEKKRTRIERITLFTETTKMGCLSWSLPAGPPCAGCGGDLLGGWEEGRVVRAHGTCPVSRVRADRGKAFVCHDCYALKGTYGFALNQARSAIKLEWMRRALTREGTAYGKPTNLFVEAMVRALMSDYRGKSCDPSYFRVHDSGDFCADYRYVDSWAEIARIMNSVTFWSPTRDWVFFPEFAAQHGIRPRPELARSMRAMPANFILRPSALHVGDSPPDVDGLAAGTAVLPEVGYGLYQPVAKAIQATQMAGADNRRILEAAWQARGWRRTTGGHWVDSAAPVVKRRRVIRGNKVAFQVFRNDRWTEGRAKNLDKLVAAATSAAERTMAGDVLPRCVARFDRGHCHCSAYDRGGSCQQANCRTCWDSPQTTVDYPEH